MPFNIRRTENALTISLKSDCDKQFTQDCFPLWYGTVCDLVGLIALSDFMAVGDIICDILYFATREIKGDLFIYFPASPAVSLTY